MHPERIAAGLLADALAIAPERRAGRPERPDHRRLRRALGAVGGERIDEHREAERVRPEDELLPVAVRDSSGLGELGDHALPLLPREPHLGDESVEVPRQGPHHLPQPRIRAAVEARDRRRGDLLGTRGAHAGLCDLTYSM